jgi:hypothetical protein
MNSLSIRWLAALISLGLCGAAPIWAQTSLSNRVYQLTVSRNGQEITVSRRDVPRVRRVITPALRLFYSEHDPGHRLAALREEVTNAAGWKSNAAAAVETDLFKAASSTVFSQPLEHRLSGRQITFRYAPSAQAEVTLTIELPEGDEAPAIAWQCRAQAAGWFSVGFVGIAPQPPETLDFLYAPLVWSWRRFPAHAYLTPEAFCTTAAVFTNQDGITEGLAPDVAEIPYRFAKFDNSRFGLALRDEAGRARPMLFAPILGGAESKRAVNEAFAFRQRYVLQGGDWYAGVRHILRDLFHYRDERRNATVSLNGTLENMLAYAMDDHYSGWVAELKGSDYRFDVPGTVKNVSALHPLALALVTGDEELYRRRALPMIEYVMSRQKYLYATDETITKQNPSHFLRGPCVEVGELASLSAITSGQTTAFRAEAERLFGQPRQLNLQTVTGGASWQDQLALYRLTGQPQALQKARAGADEHLKNELATLPQDFNTNSALRDKQAAFQVDYGPRWCDLLELYEETRERKYLDAAAAGARQFLLWQRSHPLPPASEITVNEAGRVPGVFPGRRTEPNSHEFTVYDTTTRVAEQRIPAWRTSLNGLPPEQGRTYQHGPIMLAHHAAWFLRLAHYTDDRLLAEAAYNAVIGRYANFPGYYFTSLHTNVYQLPDYPLHSYFDVKYNAIFYNHIWPHLALLLDFLVSDAFYRSGGRVDFPSAYAPGYAFLTSKVYGHRLGKIFDNEAVALWLPKRAVESSTVALNHLFGAGENDLYLVLTNTEPAAVDARLRLNADVIPFNAGQTYRLTLYAADGTPRAATMRDGVLDVRVSAKGLLAVKIHGLKVETAFQRRVAAQAGRPLPTQSFTRLTSGKAALGQVTGMLISVVPEFADAFIYSDATEKQTRRMRLAYRVGEGAWQQLEDAAYPFEFSVQLRDPAQPLEFTLEAEDRQGQRERSAPLLLRR